MEPISLQVRQSHTLSFWPWGQEKKLLGARACEKIVCFLVSVFPGVVSGVLPKGACLVPSRERAEATGAEHALSGASRHRVPAPCMSC